MKPPDEALFSLVRQWIAKAELDYRTAESLLRDPDPIRESIAFHSQQTAEKYLKAFLVCRKIEFPKTHSIVQLLDLVSTIAPDLADSLDDAIDLTPLGVEIRYPGDFPELLPGQERAVFDVAERTRGIVAAQLRELIGEG